MPVSIINHPNKPKVGDPVTFSNRVVGYVHSFDSGPYLEGICYYVKNIVDLHGKRYGSHCFTWAYYDKGVKLNSAFSWPNKFEKGVDTEETAV